MLEYEGACIYFDKKTKDLHDAKSEKMLISRSSLVRTIVNEYSQREGKL